MATFNLEIDLSNDEAQAEPDTVLPAELPAYLMQVAGKLRAAERAGDRDSQRQGGVEDGDGMQIGTYWIEED